MIDEIVCLWRRTLSASSLLVWVTLVAACQAGSPSLSPSPTPSVGWGPLAVATDDFGAEGLATGTIRITDLCAHLINDDEERLLIWDASRADWSVEDIAVLQENHDGVVVTLRDGDVASLSGGNMSGAYGDTPQAWVSAVDWVAPPDPSCAVDHAWWVNDVVEVR